jgi:ParB family chromosome partitioning protein
MSKKQIEAVIVAEQTVPLNKIIEWPDNPRLTRSNVDQEQFAANLLVQGQIMPFLLQAVPGSDLFYAIDGESRRRAMNANVDGGKCDADMQVKSEILDPTIGKSQLLSIAVAVNTIRQAMNPIDEMIAYREMAFSGLKPRAIADIFNLSTREVTQRISLGNLVPNAQALVRAGKRHLGWAEAMTLGSPAEQEQVVLDIEANPAAFPDKHSVKAHFERGTIKASMALFPQEDLGKCLVRDLFAEQDGGGHFTDAKAFWDLQLAEVEKKKAELLKTHKSVRIFDREKFSDIEWAKADEPTDATAVIVTYDSGEVVVHECMLPPMSENMKDDDQDDGDFLSDAQDGFGGDLEAGVEKASDVKVVVNPLNTATKDTQQYLEAQIRAGLRVRVAKDPDLAMALVVAATLTRSGKVASPLAVEGVGIEQKLQTADVFADIGYQRKARDTILRESGINAMSSIGSVVASLMAMDKPALHSLFAWTVSESVLVPMNESTFEVMDALGAEVMAGWRIEPTYLETLNQAQVRALASEVVAVSSQPSRNSSLAIVKKAILESVENDELQGDWVGEGSGWLPPQITSLRDAVAARKDAEAQDAAQAAQVAKKAA